MDFSNGTRHSENAHRKVCLDNEIPQANQITSGISLIPGIRYYELDDEVLREILGKKLASRHRKDLDEVSEKTSISLRSSSINASQ